MHGLDPKTFVIAPGGVTFTVQVLSIPKTAKACASVSPQPTADPACVITLTPRQKTLVTVEGGDETIPDPTLAATPGGTVLVNKSVAFKDTSASEVGPLTESGPGVGTVTMRAIMKGYTVYPLGPDRGDVSVSCSGSIAAGATDTPASLPGACWYAYTQSSAGQGADNEFAAYAVATWTIQYSVNGGQSWTDFNTFTKTGQTPIPVDEIQTVVVGD